MNQKNKHLRTLVGYVGKYRRFITISSVGLFAISFVSYATAKTALPVTYTYQGVDVAVDKPISFTVNQHLQSVDTGKLSILPKVEGAWQKRPASLIKPEQIIFTPKTYFKENTKYTVSLPKAKRLYGTEAQLPTLSFTTEKAPSIASSNLRDWKPDQTIPADSSISVTLSSPNRHLRDMILRTTPETKYDLSSDGTSFTWKSADLLPQDTDITYEIYDRKNEQSLAKKTVRVAADPSLTSPISQRDIDKNDAITLTFASGITSSTANIVFDTPGKGAWTNDMTYVFTPDALSPGTTTRYTVAKGLRSQDGGILRQDIVGDFSTIGPITVTAMSPYGKELAQGSQTLSFTFSRPVDHTSAEQRLSISSGQVTEKSWKGNTLYVKVANIGYQQTFSASIAAGVLNATFGQPSNRSFDLSFTTEVRSTRMSIPMYRQQHSATCTAASLRMVLAYRGIGSDETGLVNAMGYRPRDIDKSTDPPTWDDPMTMFVGSIDGSIIAGTGAGPDAPPIAKAARAYGRSASAVTGIGAGWIAEQLYAGNPVIMFGAFRATGITSWKTPDGTTRTMNLTGHVSVVTGVKGEPSNPLGFWINDPLNGTYYWSAAQVNANIARDPYRQAVVIY